MKRITIDGSQGEGGGQVLRSALALSSLTKRPFSIDNIRAGRKKPGLMRQHLTALRAAAAVCEAEISGAEIGARRVTFDPGQVQAGEYRFAVGSAGSACLVLQTVLPPLLTAKGPSKLTLEGGTHNPWAPPYDFLERTFLPLLARMGAQVSSALVRHGFYPAGGGEFSVEIEPVKMLTPLELVSRGALVARKGVVTLANLPAVIGKREVDQLTRRISWPGELFEMVDIKNSVGPGNIVTVELHFEELTELFTAFGEKGVPVPRVIDPLVQELRAYLAAEAPVGVHLADQLLIPMAMAGAGAFRTVGLSQHTTTNIAVIESFLEVHIQTERQERGDVLVTIG